eukprot:3854412-Prymnesium_polylepis.1
MAATVQQIQLELEAACSSFLQAATPEVRAGAEAALMAFRRVPNAVPVCRHVLQHSAVPYAQLQALYTLREGLGREWGTLHPAEREGLQQQLLQMLSGGDALEAFVGAAAVQLLAVHAKHELLNGAGPEGAAALALMHHAAALVQGAAASHGPTATQMLLALVTEFGAPTGGAAGGGLSWASHARARLAFQERQLLGVFQLGLQQLEWLASACGATADLPAARPLAAAQLRWLEQCATLLTTALSWDFDGLAEAASAHGAVEGEARPGLNAIAVRPPADQAGWRQFLGRPALVGCVLRLRAVAAQDTVAASVGHALRQLLVQLASVTRRIFDSDE